jgi:hypothetical protein
MIQGGQHRTLTHLTSDQKNAKTTSSPNLPAINTNIKSPYTASPSLEELSGGSAFTFKTFIEKTAKKASISINTALTSDVFKPKSPISLKENGILKDSGIVGFRKLSDSFLKDEKLMTSHHLYSEMQFIMTLVDISDRLRSVPKQARQSTLIAELTLLNHNLPAEVYIPFGCKKKQHKVARISLTDCVVLNSADRVPFLMMVEVFERSECGDSPSITNLELSFENTFKEKAKTVMNYEDNKTGLGNINGKNTGGKDLLTNLKSQSLDRYQRSSSIELHVSDPLLPGESSNLFLMYRNVTRHKSNERVSGLSSFGHSTQILSPIQFS